MSNSPQTVTLANGNLYLDAEVFETYFPAIESVILLHKAPDILILPVRQEGAGGLLVKIKNARGDRVIHASEFFQSINPDMPDSITLPVQWNSQEAALVLPGGLI